MDVCFVSACHIVHLDDSLNTSQSQENEIEIVLQSSKSKHKEIIMAKKV